MASSLSPEFPLLGLLIQSPCHGYALHAKLDQEFGELWNISLSQTYNILKRLEGQGLIAGARREQPGSPDRYVVQATKKGRRHFQDWLMAASSSSSQALRVEFLTRLYFARRQPSGLDQRLIEEQEAETAAGIERLERRLIHLAASNPVNQWALEIRISQLKALLAWLRQTKGKLTKHNGPTREIKP